MIILNLIILYKIKRKINKGYGNCKLINKHLKSIKRRRIARRKMQATNDLIYFKKIFKKYILKEFKKII